MLKHRNHGGARKGSGPTKSPDSLTKIVTCRVKEIEHQRLMEKVNGEKSSVTAYVRRLILSDIAKE